MIFVEIVLFEIRDSPVDFLEVTEATIWGGLVLGKWYSPDGTCVASPYLAA